MGEMEEKSQQIVPRALPKPQLHLPNDGAGEGLTPAAMASDCMVLSINTNCAGLVLLESKLFCSQIMPPKSTFILM